MIPEVLFNSHDIPTARPPTGGVTYTQKGLVVPIPAGKVPLTVRNTRFLGTDMVAFICEAGHLNSILANNIASFLLDTNRGSTEALRTERPQRKTDCSRR
jgi:hypothetical protein